MKKGKGFGSYRKIKSPDFRQTKGWKFIFWVVINRRKLIRTNAKPNRYFKENFQNGWSSKQGFRKEKILSFLAPPPSQKKRRIKKIPFNTFAPKILLNSNLRKTFLNNFNIQTLQIINYFLSFYKVFL